MALAPFRRPFASDIWDPLGSTVFDPFASTSLMGMTDPTFTSSQAINRLSPLLAADLIETPTDFHVHVSDYFTFIIILHNFSFKVCS